MVFKKFVYTFSRDGSRHPVGFIVFLPLWAVGSGNEGLVCFVSLQLLHKAWQWG